jgi:hypothetical protein
MKGTRPINLSSMPFWVAVVVLLIVVGFVAHRSASPQLGQRRVATNAVTTSAPTSSTEQTRLTSLHPTTPASPNPSGFKLHPFPVAKESATHQWTAENGRDTNVIRQLAHNELEYQRMVDENSRIQRRQLVYRKETAAAVMEHARATGEMVKQLTLPGLDGQELQFAINRADLEPSKLAGSFTGQLANRNNSMVTLSYKFGRESFTVLSPDDGIYLQAWPRESGEVMITSFDPDIYQAMPEGEPIMTTNTFKIAQ